MRANLKNLLVCCVVMLSVAALGCGDELGVAQTGNELLSNCAGMYLCIDEQDSSPRLKTVNLDSGCHQESFPTLADDGKLVIYDDSTGNSQVSDKYTWAPTPLGFRTMHEERIVHQCVSVIRQDEEMPACVGEYLCQGYDSEEGDKVTLKLDDQCRSVDGFQLQKDGRVAKNHGDWGTDVNVDRKWVFTAEGFNVFDENTLRISCVRNTPNRPSSDKR